MLDQLYIYALLYDAPTNVKEALLPKSNIDTNWNHLCNKAEKLALGGSNTKDIHSSLRSIFSIIDIPQIAQGQEPKPASFTPTPLTISEQHFPNTEDIDPEKKTATLWQAFIQASKTLSFQTHDKRYGETILQLLFKYASTIPCCRKGHQAVSFYDLARLRAGIAIAMARQGNTSDGVCLIGGDISGIQNFLYDIVSKNASRNLKGRSFYLYLLVNNIIDELLNQLELYSANVAFDSGGNFLLIAPNTKAIKERLSDLESQLNEKLFNEYRTTITCSLGTSVLNTNSSLATAFSTINKLQTAKKGQPYLSKVKGYEELFEPTNVEEGGCQARDVITGEEISDAALKNAWYFDPTDQVDLFPADTQQQEAGNDLISHNTALQIILGQRLKNFEYWIKADSALPELNDLYIQKDIHIEVLGLGIYNYLLTKDDLNKYWSALQKRAITIYAINDLSLPDQLIPENWHWKFHLYGGNKGPTVQLKHLKKADQKVPMTFSEMAGAIEDDRIEHGGDSYEKRELNFKRLGVLRMDVDSLGRIFREGIPSENYCLASYCNLSRSMDFFFKGYLNKVWNQNDRPQHTQIIYAGGDDLFIVGRWDKVYEFAKDIKDSFIEWTAQNPSISISGGMVIVTHKYPIIKAALKAGEAEDLSKGFVFFSDDKRVFKKNAFSLFQFPLRWSEITTEERFSDEFGLLMDLAEKLYGELAGSGKSNGLPISILRNIYGLSNLQMTGRNRFAWKWQAAYTLSQMGNRLNQNNTAGKKLFEELKEAVLLGKYKGRQFRQGDDTLSLLAMAARITELQKRTKQKQLT